MAPKGVRKEDCVVVRVQYSDAVENVGPPEPAYENAAAGARSGKSDYWIKISEGEAGYDTYPLALGKTLRERCPELKDIKGTIWVEIPPNYVLYSQHRNGRTDKYMYGLPTGQKFRSANEFLPHIFWLSRIKNRGFFMKTEQDSDYDVPTPEDIGNLICGCAYCGGKPRSSSSNATRVQRITRKHYDDEYKHDGVLNGFYRSTWRTMGICAELRYNIDAPTYRFKAWEIVKVWKEEYQQWFPAVVLPDFEYNKMRKRVEEKWIDNSITLEEGHKRMVSFFQILTSNFHPKDEVPEVVKDLYEDSLNHKYIVTLIVKEAPTIHSRFEVEQRYIRPWNHMGVQTTFTLPGLDKSEQAQYLNTLLQACASWSVEFPYPNIPNFKRQNTYLSDTERLSSYFTAFLGAERIDVGTLLRIVAAKRTPHQEKIIAEGKFGGLHKLYPCEDVMLVTQIHVLQTRKDQNSMWLNIELRFEGPVYTVFKPQEDSERVLFDLHHRTIPRHMFIPSESFIKVVNGEVLYNVDGIMPIEWYQVGYRMVGIQHVRGRYYSPAAIDAWNTADKTPETHKFQSWGNYDARGNWIPPYVEGNSHRNGHREGFKDFRFQAFNWSFDKLHLTLESERDDSPGDVDAPPVVHQEFDPMATFDPSEAVESGDEGLDFDEKSKIVYPEVPNEYMKPTWKLVKMKAGDDDMDETLEEEFGNSEDSAESTADESGDEGDDGSRDAVMRDGVTIDLTVSDDEVHAAPAAAKAQNPMSTPLSKGISSLTSNLHISPPSGMGRGTPKGIVGHGGEASTSEAPGSERKRKASLLPFSPRKNRNPEDEVEDKRRNEDEEDIFP